MTATGYAKYLAIAIRVDMQAATAGAFPQHTGPDMKCLLQSYMRCNILPVAMVVYKFRVPRMYEHQEQVMQAGY
jgi:hypothetical protein